MMLPHIKALPSPVTLSAHPHPPRNVMKLMDDSK